MAGSGSEPEGEFHSSYHEEDGRLVLTNPSVELGFSSADGTIVSLVEREAGVGLVDADEAAAEGALWRLELLPADGEPVHFTSRDCVEFTHSLGRHRHEGALQLWLQWRGLKSGQAVLDAAVTARISFPDESSCIGFNAEIELPASCAARSLAFPCVAAVGHPDPLVDEGLFLPISGGILVPVARAAPSGGEKRSWELQYPGPASLQFFGCSCGDRAALWLAAQDPDGHRKMLAASGMRTSGRLQFCISHFPTPQADGRWTAGYSCTLGVVNGDWFEAARAYRTCVAGQPWVARGRGGERILPPLTTAYGLWASHWGGARRCVSAVRELQRIVNVPIKLDWRCWHKCARDGAYPDYLPPRDGDDAQATAEQQLGDAGVLDQLSLNAFLASEESTSWQQHDLAPHAVQSGDESGPVRRPTRPPLAAMCPGTAHWRDLLAGIAGEMVQRGADGILLEDIGSARATWCRAIGHGHRADDPAEWTSNLRDLIAAVRAAVGNARQLATDEVVETCLADLDAFLSPHAAAERQIVLSSVILSEAKDHASSLSSEQFARPIAGAASAWQPIPLFASVYHDYTTVIGPGVSLVNQLPHDPAWAASAIAELREPANVMQRDYQTQFCLEVARAVVWGYQPLLEAFSPEQARDDSNRHKLAFLAAALRAQSWGIGALIPQSQFMGPVTVECPSIEVDMLVNPPYSTAAERRSYRRALPSVLASAWRVPGGGLALVLVNIHNQTVDFTARLRSSRLGLQLPLRLMGRTFSEDGDVPAASLGSSGSEITGKLPGRAIVLVSLR